MSLQQQIEHVTVGSTVRVLDVQGEAGTVMRIRELGLTNGTVCRIVRKAPFGGPIEVVIGSTHIGFRSVAGLCILVELHDAITV